MEVAAGARGPGHLPTVTVLFSGARLATSAHPPLFAASLIGPAPVPPPGFPVDVPTRGDPAPVAGMFATPGRRRAGDPAALGTPGVRPRPGGRCSHERV